MCWHDATLNSSSLITRPSLRPHCITTGINSRMAVHIPNALLLAIIILIIFILFEIMLR